MESKDFKKTMIAVVDVINGFVNTGALADPFCGRVVEPIKRFVENAKGATVVFFSDKHTRDSVEFECFPPHCMGGFESEIVLQLLPLAENVVFKNSTNGFFALFEGGFDFAAFDRYVVCGLCTDICVLQLALCLRAFLNEKNIAADVEVLREGVETFDSPLHSRKLANDAAMLILKTNGIKII